MLSTAVLQMSLNGVAPAMSSQAHAKQSFFNATKAGFSYSGYSVGASSRRSLLNALGTKWV